LPAGARDGAVGVIFSIYREELGGAPVWSEVQNVRGGERGEYSALLGATRNEGLPVELFSTAEPRWLEVEIGGVKEPRVLLGSVPYAMVAADAQTLGGLPPSAYLRAGSTASSSGTTINVSAPVVGLKADATVGTPGYLGVFTNGTDLGNSVLFQSGNTISIGGTASLGAMTLIGNVPSGDTAGMALYNSGGGGGASVSLDMYNTYANGGIPQAKIKALDDGAFSDHLTFWTKNPGAQSNPVAERMRITSTGNVGIGTTTPGGKLEVAGNLRISGAGNGILFPDGSTQTSGASTSATTNSTGLGIGALANNYGGGNTAIGALALAANAGGFQNTAVGWECLQSSTGVNNTAEGALAMQSNTSGSSNTALGGGALRYNTTGNFNTALGNGALGSNVGGSSNTAVGTGAGSAIAGSSTIMIGNQGMSSDDHVIRIGDVQTQTYVAGISGVNVSGVPVVVSSNGQLGIAQSSRRFKEDIQDMGEASSSLMRLRPVTYRYKQPFEDGSKPLDFGLIAEEVAEVYPDLVARSQDGQIQTVMYQKLTPMLLNEVKKLNAELTIEREESKSLKDRVSELEALVRQLAGRSK
jgi:hypothetical protein